MKGQEEIMHYVMFVGELFIIFLFLYTMFGPKDAIGNNMITYFTYVEPAYLQEYLSTIMTVSSYAPGDLSVGIDLPAVPHTIEFKSDQHGSYVFVLPPKKAPTPSPTEPELEEKVKSALDLPGQVKFIPPEKPTPFLLSCSLPTTSYKLKDQGDKQTVFFRKSGEPCAITIEVK